MHVRSCLESSWSYGGGRAEAAKGLWRAGGMSGVRKGITGDFGETKGLEEVRHVGMSGEIRGDKIQKRQVRVS